MQRVIMCPVCRDEIGDAHALLAVCPACETPHHPECWEWIGGCAVFACGATTARPATAAELGAASAPLEIDDTTPDIGVAGLCAQRDAARRRRESHAVVAVSWVYMAASLAVAPAACAGLLGGASRGRPEMIVGGLVATGVAVWLKRLGDQLAIGEPRARSAHLAVCVGLAAFTVNPWITAALLGLALPFWTKRGRDHFVRCSDQT